MDFLVNLLSKTIGSWSFPWVDKKFNLNHYFEIEKELQKLPTPYAVGVVSTFGHGSNILIRGVQFLTRKTRKSKVTHAFVIINNKDKNFRSAEAIGSGIQETTLLSSIGNRDVVKILVPRYELMNEKVCNEALDYVNRVLIIDRAKNIPYDLKHDINDPERYDCSELVYRSVNYGFQKCDQKEPLKPVKRAGNDTWTPADVENCELFRTLYDSNIGLIP